MLKLEPKGEGFPITSLREIIILKKLRHRNIVALEDVYEQENNNSIAPESQSKSNSQQGRKIIMVFEHLQHDLMGLVDSSPKWDPA